MKCDGCPFHKYEVGLEDADEWCDIFEVAVQGP